MPDLLVVAREGFDGKRIRVRCERTAVRHVANRDGATAHQWFATVPRATGRSNVEYEWADFDAGGVAEAAEVTVLEGEVVARGSKRDDANRAKEFFVVTVENGLEPLGSSEYAAAQYLRERDSADNEEDADGS
jgi:hypothetical protein